MEAVKTVPGILSITALTAAAVIAVYVYKSSSDMALELANLKASLANSLTHDKVAGMIRASQESLIKGITELREDNASLRDENKKLRKDITKLVANAKNQYESLISLLESNGIETSKRKSNKRVTFDNKSNKRRVNSDDDDDDGEDDRDDDERDEDDDDDDDDGEDNIEKEIDDIVASKRNTGGRGGGGGKKRGGSAGRR